MCTNQKKSDNIQIKW